MTAKTTTQRKPPNPVHCVSEGRILHIEKELPKMEEDLKKVREAVFNGIQKSSKQIIRWLADEAPNLVNRADMEKAFKAERKWQEALMEAREQGRLEANKAMADIRDKKAKQNTIILVAVLSGVFSVIVAWIQFGPR